MVKVNKPINLLRLSTFFDLFVSVYITIIDEVLNFCLQSKGIIFYVYVYTTSHLYLIVSTKKEDINNIVIDFKKQTDRKSTEVI